MDADNKRKISHEEIENPSEKKEEVKELFVGQEVIEHTNTEEDYSHFQDGHVMLEIVNPYHDENLFIELSDEITLYFSMYHAHYFLYEYDYEEMKKDALGIVRGEYGTVSLFVENRWVASNLLKEKLSPVTSPYDLIEQTHLPEEYMQEFREKGVIVVADYWRLNDCHEFEVPKETESTKRYKADWAAANLINKITVDYHRLTKIKPKSVPEGVNWKFVTWDYTERLIIDRKTNTLEHIQNIGTGCKVSRKYEVEDGIENLLENFEFWDFFLHIDGNPDDVVEMPNETRDYTITVDYENSPSRTITGSFDKNNLPDHFGYFARTVLEFISFYGLGEILDPSVYGKARRRKSERIFCSVTFDEGYKKYYYLTDDDGIEIGDFVLVPAGKDDHTAIVEVVNIEYFSDENVPFPIEKTKRIIRKCTDEDFDLFDDEDENF